MLYPATPTLSVDGFQVREIEVFDAAAFSPAGTEGAVVSAGVVEVVPPPSPPPPPQAKLKMIKTETIENSTGLNEFFIITRSLMSSRMSNHTQQ